LSLKVVELDQNLDRDLIAFLQSNIDNIKENPNTVKNITLVTKTEDSIAIMSNYRLDPITLLGQLEYAKHILIASLTEDDE
jgi:hypothetical protein